MNAVPHTKPAKTIVVFGASGAIGQAICKFYAAQDCRVIGIGRSNKPPSGSPCASWIGWNVGSPTTAFDVLRDDKPSAAVWAQGVNYNDTIYSFDAERHAEIYAANVTYILASLQALLNNDLFAPNARLCIISSIWQNIAKQNKMSYAITKAALRGVVNALAADLGGAGILVNAVLPGALDTPMTRANLDSEQIAKFESMSPLGSLPALDDVCNLVGFLCSEANTGLTGQFIAADRGFSGARLI